MEKMKLLIPSASGLEGVVKRQLDKLGYADTRAIDGRIETEGNWQDIARINMFIRSGERVLIYLASFKAETFDDIYNAVLNFGWQDWLDKNARILTYAKSVNSKLFAIKTLCSITKKAIIDKLKKVYKCELDESGARYMIELAIKDDIATLTLDTSGDGLHKRGYRSLAYTAPLKETTASALCDLTVYNPEKEFADLFCGSGTIPIELALKELNIAPGINRNFDYEYWKCAPEDVYKKAKQEAEDVKRLDKKLKLFGFDIDNNAISISRYHAKQAGVENYIHFQVADMNNFSSKQRFGVVISNPPYGERLESKNDVQILYKQLGNLYRSLPDWNFYILTSYEGFEREFGKRADRNRKIYNANLQCYFYSFLSKKPEKI